MERVKAHANGNVGARMHGSGEGRRDESPPLEIRFPRRYAANGERRLRGASQENCTAEDTTAAGAFFATS